MALLCLIKVEAITTLKMAEDVGEELVTEVENLVGSTNRKGRSRKIKALAAKIAQYKMRCVRKGFDAAVLKFSDDFKKMDEYVKEDRGVLSELFDLI